MHMHISVLCLCFWYAFGTRTQETIAHHSSIDQSWQDTNTCYFWFNSAPSINSKKGKGHLHSVLKQMDCIANLLPLLECSHQTSGSGRIHLESWLFLKLVWPCGAEHAGTGKHRQQGMGGGRSRAITYIDNPGCASYIPADTYHTQSLLFPAYTHKFLFHYSDHGLSPNGYNYILQKQDNIT